MSPAAAELRGDQPSFQQQSPLQQYQKPAEALPSLDVVFQDTVCPADRHEFQLLQISLG